MSPVAASALLGVSCEEYDFVLQNNGILAERVDPDACSDLNPHALHAHALSGSRVQHGLGTAAFKGDVAWLQMRKNRQRVENHVAAGRDDAHVGAVAFGDDLAVDAVRVQARCAAGVDRHWKQWVELVDVDGGVGEGYEEKAGSRRLNGYALVVGRQQFDALRRRHRPRHFGLRV